MSRHFGIEAETGEIKSINTPASLLKDAARRVGSKIIWVFKVAFRFKMR